MDAITAINTIRDTLRENLTDPYEVASGKYSDRTWIYSDEPIAGAKFPQIQILKTENPTEVIDIGPNYTEHERLFMRVWFSTKNGFKVTIDGTEYKNAQFVEYMLGQIKSTLKGQFSELEDAGVGGYRNINTTSVEYDAETQLYFGAVVIRVWYFNR